MKTYKETKAEIRKLVVQFGISGISGHHLNVLSEQGHTGTNLQNAVNYFQFSPQAAKYRVAQ